MTVSVELIGRVDLDIDPDGEYATTEQQADALAARLSKKLGLQLRVLDITPCPDSREAA